MVNYLTTLSAFKGYFNIPAANTGNDILIELIIASCSDAIESHTKRKLRIRTYGSNSIQAEYGSGNGSNRYHTKEYPIFSVTTLKEDTTLAFASTTEITSGDYLLKKEIGTIRLLPASGLIFTESKDNIKLIYKAGYGTFVIITGENDVIDFTDDGGTAAATLDAGVYTGATLATEIDTQMTAAGADAFVIAFNERTGIFSINGDGAVLSLLWNDGSNISSSVARTIGFSSTANNTGALTYTSDTGVIGIPQDLEQACLMLCKRLYKMHDVFGESRFDIEQEKIDGERGGTTKFNVDAFPPIVDKILDKYLRLI
ncbi:hypothetical protein LCGC14_1436590 [marine sediment metagenome]|uniref:Uncharacterized protein n=1 Tax=marine sediment metagenome TaxID=412755 RepID=A0A0F9JM20_9ZZZZ